MHYSLTLVTPPLGYPVSVDEAKLHLRVDGIADDALIQAEIIAATALWESETSRQLMQATYDLALDDFEDILYVPKPPLQSVTSIKYLDDAGVQQVITATNYVVDTASEPGRIVAAFNSIWPIIVTNPLNSITVRFVAGYSAPGKIPEADRLAIKLLVADMYQNRETTIDRPVNEMPMLKALLFSRIVWWWN